MILIWKTTQFLNDFLLSFSDNSFISGAQINLKSELLIWWYKFIDFSYSLWQSLLSSISGFFFSFSFKHSIKFSIYVLVFNSQENFPMFSDYLFSVIICVFFHKYSITVNCVCMCLCICVHVCVNCVFSAISISYMLFLFFYLFDLVWLYYSLSYR